MEKEDRRESLINKNTGNLLNGYETKRAFVRDYMLKGNGYIYKNMDRNNVESLHYVDCMNVSVDTNCEPIFKKAKYIVGGRAYYPTEFITIARNSKNGVTGMGLLGENTLIIKLVNNMINMLNANVKGGGVKKGFLRSERNLTRDALDKLKEDFEKLYNTNTEGSTKVVTLNHGLEFIPATESSTELQLSELYKGISDDVSQLANVPENIKSGKANESEYRNWFKNCINPILEEICGALNETMLLESEKDTYFWRADTSEIEKTDLKSTFEAYKVALDGNIMQLDEVREKIGIPPLGFNYIKLGLDTVLYDTEKNVVYTPNTNMMQKMTDIDKNIDSKVSGED